MFFKTMIKAFNGENKKKKKKHSQTRDIHSSIIKALKASACLHYRVTAS